MPRGVKVNDDVIESPNNQMHTLSMEKMATMYISLQETVMHMQSEMYACKERELTLQHTMEMQKLEIKALREELHAMKNMTIQMQDNRMPEIERKMLSLEAEKEILVKANAEIKSTIEGKEDVIMTRWKDVLLKETPKITQRLSNTMDVLDAKEQYEIERRKNNIVIRGMQENETENALSLGENITKFFEDHFAMRDVIVYAAHRVGKKQLEGKSSRAIVCTILDERKRAMILDSSKVYLKGTSFFVTEDRTPQEQERRRQAYASRKANQNA